MPELDADNLASGRAELERLKDGISDRLAHWDALPTVISAALEFARRELAAGSSDPEAILQVVRALEPYEAAPQLALESVRDLATRSQRLRQRLKAEEACANLRDALHATIEQHLGPAAAGLDGIRQALHEALAELCSVTDGAVQRSVKAAAAALDRADLSTATPGEYRALVEALGAAIAVLPEVSRKRPPRMLPLHSTRHFRVVVVEDEVLWRNFVFRALAAARAILGPTFQVDVEWAGNVADAQSLLIGARSEQAATPRQEDPVIQTIAVLDMGLPADPEDAHAVEQRASVPRRANGHSLLQVLRSYRSNIPVIILTAPPYLLDDQLRACEQGVADFDYVLKGPDKQERLVAALLRVFERGQGHRVELRSSPEPKVCIDGVPVPMGVMPFRTFYALCQLSACSARSVFTPEQILDQLDERFGHDYDYKRAPETNWELAQVLARRRSGSWWHPKYAGEIANLIRLWAVRKRDARGDPVAALHALRSRHDGRVWRNALVLLELYRQAHPAQGPWAKQPGWSVNLDEALASGFEEAFGGLAVDARPGYDPGNIERHVHEIRSAIHSAFNAIHRFIEPRREVVIRRAVGEKYGYRVLGEIIVTAGPDLEPDEDLGEADWGGTPGVVDVIRRRPGSQQAEPLTVLVVENEAQYRGRIRSLLERAGFEVYEASNSEDAVAQARRCSPDVVSLDLHIPATRLEFEHDPLSGEEVNGLKALEQIRQLFRDSDPGAPQGVQARPRVLIPTTLYDQDVLREEAARLGVPVSNFVPKGEAVGGAAWEGHLLLTASRLRQEILARAVLPALPPWRCPIVQVRPGSDLASGRLNLAVNGRECPPMRGNQGKFLAVLLQHFEESVSFEDLDEAVYGRDAVGDERKNLLKNVRLKIRTEWLQIEKADPHRPELEILESVEGGLVLHAAVEGL
ncbi:MAG: hypothetical protein ACK47B_12375 [Armatimonadota bacterium]